MNDVVRPSRVLFLDHAPVWGGAEAALVRLVACLDRDRFVPLVATPTGSHLVTALESQGIGHLPLPFEPLERVGPKGLIHLRRSVWEVVRVTRRERVDLIHSNTVRTHVVGALAGAIARAPVVWTLHDSTFPAWAYRPLSALPSRIITVSDWLAAQYATGRASTRVVTIGNGLPPRDDVGHAGSFGGGSVRAELGIPADAPLVLHVGRLVPGKGADVFIAAARTVLGVIGTAHFVVVGGPGDDRCSRDHAARLAASARTACERIHLIGHRDDVTRFFAAADVFAYTSVEPEGLPTVVLEAMQHGVPVIATAIGGAAELVHDGVTSLVVPPNDNEALADAMIGLVRNETERERLGAAGSERVRIEHSLRRQVERLEALYTEVVDGRRTGRRRSGHGTSRNRRSADERS